MNKHQQLAAYISRHTDRVVQVVEFDKSADCLLSFDFTAANTSLTPDDIADTVKFSSWVDAELAKSGCRYGIGGYMEHRTLYARSELFNTDGHEPRRLHLGVDIWGPASTPVYAPLYGKIHSFQNNDHFGDYGPTIILEHDLDGMPLYSLYGHLSQESIQNLTVGQSINVGQCIAHLGNMNENGNWPPHLHFQLMFDMQGHAGDYPGVSRYSEEQIYRQNIPDPDVILQFSGATII
ncbi:peptidoglycan DD-metalloendopeptidase family protein [Mucilaginibacter robiniae]|uniref:Peptidoglycan DD-metalloendopeptidase family protein n=1 Tax=Mucilaginibacter robiniae TaxID=2728022 RepID=A0A7L5E6A8_9SPHI|nr:peptidoglycan DD-metalloendopeptidase family protein [Mucilaginibacter robiniae]QJD95916.1 peptidoglycan DD-metalloendopeptidase family protein [Mucilaginibacter robiniae]